MRHGVFLQESGQQLDDRLEGESALFPEGFRIESEDISGLGKPANG